MHLLQHGDALGAVLCELQEPSAHAKPAGHCVPGLQEEEARPHQTSPLKRDQGRGGVQCPRQSSWAPCAGTARRGSKVTSQAEPGWSGPPKTQGMAPTD